MKNKKTNIYNNCNSFSNYINRSINFKSYK